MAHPQEYTPIRWPRSRAWIELQKLLARIIALLVSMTTHAKIMLVLAAAASAAGMSTAAPKLWALLRLEVPKHAALRTHGSVCLLHTSLV